VVYAAVQTVGGDCLHGKRRSPHRRRRFLVLVFGGEIVIGILMLGSRTRGYEALLVLADLNAGARPSYLKARTAAPSRGSIRYTKWGHRYDADVYLPAEGRPGGGSRVGARGGQECQG